MGDPNPTTGYQQDDGFGVGNLQIAAYMFAGLAMMLNIRLSYSAAPYALLRFKLPENLFSVFVRTTSSALELWCIPSMLLGNIMEQIYNHTQNNPSYHATNLKNYATQIQQKADTLNTTADSQSGEELTNTRENDIKDDKNKGNQLDSKARQLKTKAQALYTVAEKLRAEATGPLEPLKQLAQSLKTASKGISGTSGLYYHANQLATQESELEPKATNVIEKFGEVKTAYDTLMDQAKRIHQETHPNVTNVTTAYNQLKEHYDKMLNLTKLAKLAKDLTGTLQTAANQLASNVTNLRNGTGSGTDYTRAQQVISQYENVESEYNLLPEKQQTNVKDKFEALKDLYDKTFKFTKIKHYSDKLSTAANQLASSGNDPTNVINNFQKVVDSYKQLDDNKSQVESQFTALQAEYSKAIYQYKFSIITIPSMITNWLNFLTFVILLIVFVTGGDNGHVTAYYWIMAISGFVFGINMVLVYAVDWRYLPFYMAGENSFPMVTSLILYFATSIFGNRRKYNSDYLVVVIDVSIAILIAFVASVLWTKAFHDYRATMSSDLTPDWPPLISPVAMVIVGMGLVYSIYPGIAPGMIVPFYLIDKIEMVLLVATAFPPVVIAILRKYAENWSPSTKFIFSSGGMGGWKPYTDNDGKTPVYGWIWHFFDLLIPLQISLAVIFIYSIHYRDSNISRAIVNQPKMSTFLSIVFYMCHEILLALGFPGMVGNGGAGGAVLLPVQYVGALLMVFLAFYSIGYITEYKRHDPSEWPTEGMTKWNALCYWLKMASKITNKNFKQLFTTDLRRDLVLCHNEINFLIHVNIN